MSEREPNMLTKEQQKSKIRERYKGINLDALEVIPAKKQADFYDDTFRRVAVYVRVSTDNLQQTSSYELQKNYYEDKVEKNENWSLVDIYADEGISGTSLNHRDAFNRMIEDCKAGKIDMIITKSVSRFSRNLVDCKTIVQMLYSLKNPVGVFFETDNLFTLNQKDSMRLSMMAMLAEEESHTKSSIMNASLEMRFGHGIVLTPVLLGYDHDEDGYLIINKNEAHTVQLIFFMYLYGYSCNEIAETLGKLGRKTKRGNDTWSSGSVINTLRNERYCGDVLTWKTFTTDFLTHKSKKNNGDRTQHRWRNHHDAIISRDDFIAVQHLLTNAKYGNKGVLPELIVISDGALRGFVSINPRWAGFTPEDYFATSIKVDEMDEKTAINPLVEAQSGDFDFRGFEITRSQFFNASNRLCMTFSTDSLKFSTSCIHKLDNQSFVEVLVHPIKKLLIIRAVTKSQKNAIQWSKVSGDGTIVPRVISGAAFLNTIYTILGWNTEYKYRARGVRKPLANESILFFDLSEVELFIPQNSIIETEKKNTETAALKTVAPILANVGKSIVAMPTEWADNFGTEFYEHSHERDFEKSKQWYIKERATSYSELRDLDITSRCAAANNIKEIMNEVKTEDGTNE